MDINNVLGQAINDIFVQHDRFLSQEIVASKKKRGIEKKQLELALAVILVDMASCDQAFDSREFQVISRGLRRVFGTQKSDVMELTQKAQAVIANLRGTANFAQLLRENVTVQEREVISQVIEEVIAADGVEDGFEAYLRSKYHEILGITPPDNHARTKVG